MELYRVALYIIFGLLPSLIWLFYYLKKDLHPEPKRMILKIFLWGVFITIPVFIIQIGLAQLLIAVKPFAFFGHFPVITEVLKWFFIIALTEEFFKYAVVKLNVFSNKEMDEPLDIMLYMVVAALGFAAAENILYLFSPIGNLSFDAVVQTAVVISIIRFLGATFLHTLCSALFGYFVALSFLKARNKIKLAFTGLLLATLLHGLYNFSIINLSWPFNVSIPVLIIVGLALFMLYDFDEIKKIKSICKL